MDFPNIDDASETLLLDLLNPFSDSDLSDILHSPCFIGFTNKSLISDAKTEEEFIDNYIKIAGAHIADFFSKVEKEGINIKDASLLMLPFTCIDTLVKDFVEYMGIPA